MFCFSFSHIGREHLDADSICQICSKVLKKESMGLHMSTAHKKSDPKTRRIQGSVTSVVEFEGAASVYCRFLHIH